MSQCPTKRPCLLIFPERCLSSQRVRQQRGPSPHRDPSFRLLEGGSPREGTPSKPGVRRLYV